MDNVAVRGPVGGRATNQDISDLLVLARARPEHAWEPTNDIRNAHNAHSTNTRAELSAALRGNYDWLEGDVRLTAAGEPVMQHDRAGSHELTLREWLRVAAASGRGAKVDIKEPSALGPTLDALAQSGIHEGRMIINVAPWPGVDLAAIRTRFPNALVNISARTSAHLRDAELGAMLVAARQVGGRVMFPVRHDLLTEHVIDTLKPYGRIATWNAPELTDPNEHTAERLRRAGVDGTIDLRDPEGFKDTATARVLTFLSKLVGWNAVRWVLDAAGQFDEE